MSAVLFHVVQIKAVGGLPVDRPQRVAVLAAGSGAHGHDRRRAR